MIQCVDFREWSCWVRAWVSLFCRPCKIRWRENPAVGLSPRGRAPTLTAACFLSRGHEGLPVLVRLRGAERVGARVSPRGTTRISSARSRQAPLPSKQHKSQSKYKRTTDPRALVSRTHCLEIGGASPNQWSAGWPRGRGERAVVAVRWAPAGRGMASGWPPSRREVGAGWRKDEGRVARRWATGGRGVGVGGAAGRGGPRRPAQRRRPGPRSHSAQR